MPTRPRSHWIDPEAVRAFEEAAAPVFNFYERPQPEYGIDGEVEEFDEDDRATGLHFFVQLKGTDEADLDKALGVDIKVDTANYYRAAPLPVLMVRYHAPSKALYARWFHQYDPYDGRGGVKTLRFRWRADDLWLGDTSSNLAEDARAFLELRKASLRLPRPVHLVTSGAFGLTPAEISIALRAAGSGRADLIDVRSGPPPAGEAWIAVSDSEIRADLAKVTAATLHIPDSSYAELADAEQVAIDSLTLLALAFERLGQDDTTSRLAATYFARSTLVTDLDVAFGLSSSMARAHRIAEALELSDALDDVGKEELQEVALVFGFPAMSKLTSLSDVETAQYERVLKNRVKRRKKTDRGGAGRAYMNLANFNRALQRWDAAANYYREARKLDPAYDQRAHYWYELGGALFGTGQYGKAAQAYERSIELGTNEPLASALQADALMFAGKYAEALELFDTFNEQHPEDDGEYRLKARACRTIVERLGLSEQERSIGRALKAGKGPDPKTPDEWTDMALRQLGADALWGSAWLNLGLSDHDNGDNRAALESFIAATVLLVRDYETWQNAMFTAFVLLEIDTLRDLVVSGRRMGGDPLISFVVAAAAEPNSPVPRREFIGAVDALLAEHPARERRGITVRLLREDGSVDEIAIQDERKDADAPS